MEGFMSSHGSLEEACSCLLAHFSFNKGGVEDELIFPFQTAGGCLLRETIPARRNAFCSCQDFLHGGKISPGLEQKRSVNGKRQSIHVCVCVCVRTYVYSYAEHPEVSPFGNSTCFSIFRLGVILVYCSLV